MLQHRFIEALAYKLRKWRLGPRHRHLVCWGRYFALRRHGVLHEMYCRGRHIASARNISQIKNSFNGPCFILGAGPSLGEIDVARLRGFDLMTLNGAISKLLDHGLAPRHHVMIDRRAFEKQFPIVRAALESAENCFFSHSGAARICERDAELLKSPRLYLLEAIGERYDEPKLNPAEFHARFSAEPGIYLSPDHQSGSRIGFSCAGDHGFFASRTVAVWAVQLAYYLGYREIYLLGMEFGATGAGHFYDAASVAAHNTLMKAYDPNIKVCFELAAKAAAERGFEIFNLTPRSLLSANTVPRMSLEDALARINRTRAVQ